MNSIRFLSDRRLLLRQAIAAWLILFASVLLFATLAILLSFIIENQEVVIIVLLILVSPISIGTHVFLQNRGYQLAKVRTTAPSRGSTSRRHSSIREGYPMRIWSRREIWLFSFGLAVAGMLILSIPYVSVGMGLPPFPAPFAGLLGAIGVAVFLAGTVSFGVQELVRARTRHEFEIQLRDLLAKTSTSLSAELRNFLDSYVDELGGRIERLGIETHGSHIKMIFSTRENGLAAMVKAIREADSFVYMMGISLRQFFLLDTECGRAVSEVYHDPNKNIEFQVLILNNRCPEALSRSSREEGIEFKSTDDPVYHRKTLFRETEDTFETIRSSYPRMNLRVYDHQSLFLLITDKAVFMEPYHYGDRVIESAAPHLRRVAELVPLIEFEKASEKGPYEQFLGHFRYVFDKSTPPPHMNRQ